MFFIISIFFILFMQDTAKSNCGPGKSCTGGDTCMITLSTNVSATVTHCSSGLEDPKYIISWSDKNMLDLSRSEYYDEQTRSWTTSSTISYKLEELKEDIDTLYCTLSKERHTKEKRTVELQSEDSDDGKSDYKTRDNCILMVSLTGGTLAVVILSTSMLLYYKGYLFLQRPLDITYCSNTIYQFLIDNVTLYYTCTFDERSSDSLDENQLLQEIESRPQNRIFFIGKPGSGKTCLFQNILRKWGNRKILRKYTLIYFQLNYVTEKECSMEKLIGKVDFLISNLKATMHSQQIIVILDGLHSSFLRTDNRKRITSLLEGLLQDHLDAFKKMKLWIGCREISDVETDDISELGPSVYFKECVSHQLQTMLKKFVPSINQARGSVTADKIWDKYVFEKPPGKRLSLPLTSRLLLLILLHNSPEGELDEQIKVISQFCSTAVWEKTGAVEYLISCSHWDLLACLIEAFTEDEEEHTSYVKMLHLKKIDFKHVDDDYPRQAVLHLCYKMKKEGVTPESIKFSSRNPTFLKGYLPKIESVLIFCNTHLQNDCFHSLIKTASESCKTIQFCHSELPNKVQELPDIAEDVKVNHTRIDGNYSLNFNTRNWENVETNTEDAKTS